MILLVGQSMSIGALVTPLSTTSRDSLLSRPTLRKVSLVSRISHECSVVVITERCQRLNPGSNPGTRTNNSTITVHAVPQSVHRSSQPRVVVHRCTWKLDSAERSDVIDPEQIQTYLQTSLSER